MADPNIETTIQALGVTEVQEYEYFLKEFVDANMGNIDVSKGSVFYDLMIRPDAMFKQLTNLNINRWRRSSSLLEISKDPELADDGVVDAVLSNFGITRRVGTYSVGSVAIYLSSNTTTVIPAGSVFASGTLLFTADRTYVGVPSSDLVTNTTDRLITDAGNGLYSFTISVIAADTGANFQISRGECLTLQTPPTNYVTSKASADFTSAADEESNADLLSRLETGISGKTTASRKHIRALVRDAYPNVKHGSVVGFGDPEMHRDKTNVFNISYGGKSDIYLQTDNRPINTVVRKTATLMNASTSKWQMFFNRDEFAGVYKITSIKPAGSSNEGSLSITSDVRDIDLSPFTSDEDAFIPAVESYTQAAFSRYQTATIEFSDPTTDASSMEILTTTQEYDVELLTLPDIADIQDNLISDFWTSSHRYDDLVRAPIPCLVSLSITIKAPQGTEVNQGSIRSAVADRINGMDFSDKLSSSVIADVVHGLIDTDGYITMPIDMLGELIDPADGSSVIFRSGTQLDITTDYTKSISNKTTMFFIDPLDIDITVENY